MNMKSLTNEELFSLLCEIVSEMGWNIALPKLNEDEALPGMIIGTFAYIEGILGKEDELSTKH